MFDKLIEEVSVFYYVYKANELKSVSEVKKIFYEEALKFKEKPTDDVDISGIKVAAKNMYIIAPVIILGLLVYLLTLVIHINSILKLSSQAEEAKEFPWLALFNNKFSGSVMNASLFLFPLITSFFIVWASDFEPYLKVYWIVGYFVCFTTVQYFLDVKINKLKDRVYSNPFVNNPVT
jgi:hypothetical protein